MRYILCSVLLINLLFVGVVFAQEEVTASEATEAITVEDLGAGDPRILPTSPFYSFKEWGRGIQQTLTFNKVKKAELELKFANEKAAELKKVEELQADRPGAIEMAVANYERTVTRLKERLEVVQETSENPNIDRLLDNLTEKTLSHQQLFEELKEKNVAIRERLEEVQDDIDEAMRPIPEKFDTPEQFRERLEKATENQKETLAKHLDTVKVINRLEDKIESPEVREKLVEAKDNLVMKFEGVMRAYDISAQEVSQLLEDIKGDEIAKLKILDEVTGRIQNTALKTTLGELRPQLLEQVGISVRLDPKFMTNSITKVEALIQEAEERIAVQDETVKNSDIQLLEQARIKLQNVKQLQAGEKNAEAFGQLNTARVMIQNTLRVEKRVEGFSDDAGSLQTQLARLKGLVESEVLSEEDNPRVYALIEQAERIIENIVAENDVIEAKQLLAELEALIKKETNTVSVPSAIRSMPPHERLEVCPLEFDPVCGEDGKTYSNKCKARVAGVEIASEGKCGETGRDDRNEDENPSIIPPINIQDIGSQLLKPLQLQTGTDTQERE